MLGYFIIIHLLTQNELKVKLIQIQSSKSEDIKRSFPQKKIQCMQTIQQETKTNTHVKKSNLEPQSQNKRYIFSYSISQQEQDQEHTSRKIRYEVQWIEMRGMKRRKGWVGGFNGRENENRRKRGKREMDCEGSNGGERKVEDQDYVTGKSEWNRGGSTHIFIIYFLQLNILIMRQINNIIFI